MGKIFYEANNRKYIITFRATPKMGDYEGMDFYIKSNEMSFNYCFKISGALWQMLINQNILHEANAVISTITALIRFAKQNISEGNEKNIDFMFESKNANQFKKLLENHENEKISEWDLQKKQILKYLYDAHYQIFNKDDIPVSIRILSSDLQMEKRRIKDLVLSLCEQEKVEIIDQKNDNIFVRITHKGVEEIGK